VLKLHRRAGDPPFIGCASHPGTTIISSAEARIFEQRRVFSWAFVPSVYGCLYSVDQRVAFGPNGFDEGNTGQALTQFRLAGPYVAYACGGNWSHGCWSGVRVVDLRDGSPHRSPQMPTWAFQAPFVSGPAPADVELKDNSSVAWIIADLHAGGPPGAREVGALDTSGQRLLDSGPNLDPQSLELNGSTLTWVNAGVSRTATLD
jgi:hypothetical protein